MTASADPWFDLFVRLPEPMHLALRARAEQEETTMAAVMREALAEHLAQPVAELHRSATADGAGR